MRCVVARCHSAGSLDPRQCQEAVAGIKSKRVYHDMLCRLCVKLSPTQPRTQVLHCQDGSEPSVRLWNTRSWEVSLSATLFERLPKFRKKFAEVAAVVGLGAPPAGPELGMREKLVRAQRGFREEGLFFGAFFFLFGALSF